MFPLCHSFSSFVTPVSCKLPFFILSSWSFNLFDIFHLFVCILGTFIDWWDFVFFFWPAMSNQLCLSKILIFMYCISFLKIVSIHLIVFDWPLGLGFDYLFAAAAKLLQSCSTLCIPIDGSPPGSPIHGILQARILEWIAISFSNAWKWKVTVKSLSRVWLLVTPWTAAYQSAPSMEFSRQEYWSGLPLPSLDYLFSVLIFCFVSNNSNNCNFLSFLIIFKLLLLVSYFLMGFMFDWELFLAGL